MNGEAMNESKTATLTVKGTCQIQDLGGGVYLVDGVMVAGPAKMLAAVSSALHLEPKPRAPRKPNGGAKPPAAEKPPKK